MGLDRNTRVNKRMEKYQFNLDRCYMYYFDENNNPANYSTTPPPPPTTVSVSSQSTGSLFWSRYLVPVIAGSVGVVLLACCVILCCVCTARRERKKRKEIEGEYKIVASTLTNITDSEDGCTYETLSMRDPTYNSGVKLPTRKHKGKIKGVSNPFSAVRRLLSEDGESTGSTDTSITYTSDYKRSQPLPAIPEAFNNKDNVKAIDEYTEIGSDVVRGPSEYHHLHLSGRQKNDFIDGNPYDALRQSKLLEYGKDSKKTDEYFVLETKMSEGNDQEVPTNQQSGGYFCLEKVQRVNSESGLCKNNSQGVVIPPESVRALENNLLPPKESTERVPKVNQEEIVGESSEVRPQTHSEQTQNRLSNAYFTLASENDSNPTQLPPPPNDYLDLENPPRNRTSYVEPSEIQRHSYVDVVAEFANGKNTKGGSMPAYAAVKK